ncbi:hypothetical protein RP20_CCG023925 [Aedes albopictus]|nr:hypothetical protein RP20_CCG023925 [Aedes albopictus]
MLPLVLVVSVLLQLSLQQEVPGVLQKRNKQAAQRTAFPSDNETCDGTRYFSTCAGCDAVNVCLGEGMDWRYCRQMNPDKPYCNNGECSATPGNYEYCPPSLYCSGSGYYPDPNNCDIYHFCEGKYSMSSVYKCPSNYVFNPATNFCKRKVQESDCMKVKCSPEVIFSAYGTSKRFFGYCRYGSGLYPYETEVHRCPEGTEFNGKTCAFQCPAEGRFPDSSNQRGFYECYYLDNEALTAVYQTCPVDKVYDSKLSTCVQLVTTTRATTTSL